MLNTVLKDHNLTTEGQSALDIGCGTGVFVDYWSQRGAEVTGMDFTDVSIAKLEKQYPEASFVQADLSDPRLEAKQTYDYISIFDVMFHIVEHGKFSQAAQNLAKLSRPGTKVFITDDFGTKTRSTLKHVRKRSLEMYQEVFSAQGFRLLNLRPLFFMMLPPEGFASSFLRWLGILGWEAVTFLARWEMFGGLVGRLMYGFDAVMRRVFPRSPAGQMAVFEYAGSRAA